MVNGVPMQGDIININLNPKKGHEQQGYRPYICLSNKIISNNANIAVFAPISQTERKYPMYIQLEDTITKGVVMLDQLVTIDYNARKFVYVETVPAIILKNLLVIAPLVFQPNEPV